MDAAATNELEDEGDVEGYPREGLCLAVLGDGRAHPAWLCRTRAPAANGRRRVLLYGDGRGASRALNPSERVDPLPGDAALCARLQQDWKDASPGDRDGLLRALDELEARRCAPPSFGAMVKSVRATMAKGPMSAFAPSACLGREFYPNLFPPRVGDAVRVLWDGDVWYEATATGKGDADARADGPARTAAAEKGPAVACGAFYGFDSGDDRELRVRYVEDGTRDSLAWPDPEGEAWLLGPPPGAAAADANRRRTSGRSGGGAAMPRDWRPLLVKTGRGKSAAFEKGPEDVGDHLGDAPRPPAKPRRAAPAPAREPAPSAATTLPPRPVETTRAWTEALAAVLDEAEAPPSPPASPRRRLRPPSPAPSSPRGADREPLRALAAARKRVARVGDALRNVAVPLAGLLDDFDDGGHGTPAKRKRDDGDEPPKDDAPPGDWPWAWDEAANARPVKALFALARALRPVADVIADLEARAKGAAPPPPERRHAVAAKVADHAVASFAGAATDADAPAAATLGDDGGRLQRAVDDVAKSWDKASADETFGPGAADADAARGSPCFALLPDTRVPEPHRSWLRRAQRAAAEHLDAKRRAADAASNASSPASDPSTKKKKKLTAKQKREEEERERKRAKQEERDAAFASRAPRPYRPPGAAARAALCGDRGVLLMETVAPPVCECLGGGVGGGALTPGSAVVTLDGADGDMLAGERGVVAASDIAQGAAAPYAGVVVTDAELGDLLRRAPRAAARWLMYRYEFAGASLSVLPYLGCGDLSPAPFINCARGPSAKEALVVGASRAGRARRAEPPRSPDARSPGKGSHRRPGERAHRWRSWGSDHIGQRVRRTVFGSDGASALGHADGTVVAWLDEHESDFVDGTGARAALWRVRYDDDGLLTGDHEDLELHELLASAKAPALEAAAAAEDAALARKANCHFAEITADDARPGLNVAASVVGVFVVATRNIAAGEPLLVSYGKEFWAGWAQRKARLDDLEAAADDLVDAARDALAAPDDARRAADDAARRSLGGTRPGDAWRSVVGVPFESARASRGAMRWRGVVVGLVVDAPDASDAERAGRFAAGDRVEGYWRGSAPPWPATVGAVGADGRLSLAYDDGGVEDDVPPGLCRAATRPPAWRATRRLAVGTWVRRIDPPKDDAPPEGPKKKKLKKPPKQEGVVAALRDDGAFDVLDDDGTLVEQCTARDWEPLLVLRYEEGHDQRVVSMAQLRHLKPQFLDARTLRRPRLDDGDGDLCPEPPVDLRRVLKDSGIKEPRENRRHREDAAASPL